ncbi:ubiquitin binding protein [Auriculariales sp. MPI-PUGE-AT-0066]|nr:ubiquitin binding protein [Auriculariales sp. MPI-PUGE-AT-0066]
MTSLLWGGNYYFDEAVAKATSELLPGAQEDVAANLEICDQVRSKAVQPKDAMRSLKKRLGHANPNVQLLALGLTDACIKNGGDHFLVEVASREFMDNLVSIIKQPTVNREVRDKVLRLIQNWAMAFEQKPVLSYVPALYKQLKGEGFQFPPYDPLASTAAMVDSQTAPEWIDSEVCLRCRTAFTTFNRKHHCRNCGQQDHGPPHFGIMEPVRVCDTCYSKLHKNKERTDKAQAHAHHRSQSFGGSTALSRRHDPDLQRAIELSLQESQSSSSGHHRPGYVPAQPSNWQVSEPPLVNYSSRPQVAPQGEDDDPELRAAIEASLREANAPKASAPMPLETPTEERSRPAMVLPNYDLDTTEADAILSFNQTVDDAQTQGPAGLSRYSGVNEMYDRANGLRPKLALSLDDTGRKEQLLTEMHDKLSQAVKLYDSLLSEQLARPAWRPQSQYAAPARSQTHHHQPQQYGYAASYAPAPVAAPPAPPMSAPISHAQSGWSTNPIGESSASAFAPSPAPEPMQHWQPVSIAPQHVQPSVVYAPQTIQSPVYASATSPPPAPLSYAPAPAPQAYAPAPVPTSPPMVPRSTGLARHNTVHSAPAQRAAAILAAPAAPAAPLFPTVPAANPQYGIMSPPNSMEQTERKEAQLISFD